MESMQSIVWNPFQDGMKSSIGSKVRLTVFGESHGVVIGCVLEGLPAGHKIDMDLVLRQMERRAPGKDKTATTRNEADTPEIVSGVLDGVTTGAPIAILIKNTDTKSHNYDNLKDNPRPNHSDYAAAVKYGGYNDVRGGGHFSAHLTAPIVAAGAICRSLLKEKGITVGGHILSIGSVLDTEFDAVNVKPEELNALSGKLFALNDTLKEEEMRAEVEKARAQLDSVGGSVELAVTGLPAGVGNPMFYGVENVIASILYGIPAVKAVSFGKGENFASCTPGTQSICGAYCLPEYRGQGIAAALLSHIVEVLKTEHAQLLGVDCETFNPTAMGFWSKYFTQYTVSVVRRIDENAVI